MSRRAKGPIAVALIVGFLFCLGIGFLIYRYVFGLSHSWACALAYLDAGLSVSLYEIKKYVLHEW